MKHLEDQLSLFIKQAIQESFSLDSFDDQLQFQSTRKEFEGDLTLLVFPLTRYSKQSPESTAETIGAKLIKDTELVVGYNVVKGFLNLTIASDYWQQALVSALREKDTFGFNVDQKRPKQMVEFASPNTNKPLHLGHLRNIFLGDSLSRIFKAAGSEVVKVQIINDRGIHICKSMLAWQKFGDEETPESSGMKGDHFVGKYYVIFDQKYKEEIAQLVREGMEQEEAEQKAPILLEARKMLQDWEAGEETVVKLWRKMNQWVYNGFEATYAHIGTSFDKLYYESDTYLVGKEKVLQFTEHEDFFSKEDGSFWVSLEKEGLDNKILLRADGTSVYMTQDIGTAILREDDFACDHYHYVVGNEQDYHFKVLKLILQKMAYPWADGISHLSYGMVDLPSGKMKSREGTVVDADDIMHEMETTAAQTAKELGKIEELSEEEQNELFETIGLGALKYFILKVDPKKNMLFDPEESIDFNGNTGPFIQYTHARIKSILSKVGGAVLQGELKLPALADEDRTVVKALLQFPEVILESAEQLSPALLANYLYGLVKDFNHFYQNTPPLIKEENENVKQFRLALCELTAVVIERGMGLLGIRVPERM